ncbi:AAA family ATPase [Brevundimonas sp.]|uniref:AAA family ATPase n=1 Tax=Brevundimonas sp. TaxID=1871086 RepID=UPI002FC73265
MIRPVRRIVLTGGPGSGKTCLLDALEKTGHTTSPEAGRQIIRHQQVIGGQALPWENRALFAELMLEYELAAYTRAEALATDKDNMVLFDRGIPDVAGYLNLCALPVPPYVKRAAQMFRYDLVFIAPFWPEIFTQDDERKQDLDEARRTCHAMASIYHQLGYTPVELPKVSVKDRVAFVQNELRRHFSR